MVMLMNFFKLYHSLTDISRIFLHFLIAVSASLILTSYICFIFADLSCYYYDLRLLSIELLTLLRSSFFMLSTAVLITNHLD
jgi:hypothetical protein